MSIYVALLRGINVGGHNVIKMKDLKELLDHMGMQNVSTYIQSGNIVFEADKKADLLQSSIEQALIQNFGLTANVILRTKSQWKEIISSSPYPTDSLDEGESVHLALFKHEPSNTEQLLEFTSDDEECYIKGTEVYLLLKKSFRDAKLPAHLQKLGIPVTIRNWKTIKKLEAMALDL